MAKRAEPDLTPQNASYDLGSSLFAYDTWALLFTVACLCVLGSNIAKFKIFSVYKCTTSIMRTHVSFWSHYFIILLFLRLLFRLFVTSLEYLFLLSKTVLINTFEVFCGQETSRQRFVRREDLSVRSPQLIVYHCNTFHFSLDISLSPVKGTC